MSSARTPAPPGASQSWQSRPSGRRSRASFAFAQCAKPARQFLDRAAGGATPVDVSAPATRTSRCPGQAAAVQLPSATPVPVLMYHVLGDPPPGAPFPQLYVSDADFAGQMRWLARHGYTAVTLRSVWDHWHGRGPLPPRPVVVSFDDGYRSVAHTALPAAARARLARRPQPRGQEPARPGGISERQVRQADRRRLGDRRTYAQLIADLTTLGDAASWRARSRARGVRCRTALRTSRSTSSATRADAYDARIDRGRAAAGFLAATTTVEGLATPAAPFELRRVRVSRSDGVPGFATDGLRSWTEPARR